MVHDESYLNEFIEKQKFRLEGWEEMAQYCNDAEFGVQFDLKKYYFEIDIAENFQTYFGFMYPMEQGKREHTLYGLLSHMGTRGHPMLQNL